MITLSLHLLLVGVVGSVGDDIVDALYSSRQIWCFKVDVIGMVCSIVSFHGLFKV